MIHQSVVRCLGAHALDDARVGREELIHERIGVAPPSPPLAEVHEIGLWLHFLATGWTRAGEGPLALLSSQIWQHKPMLKSQKIK
jgi:hypothetical protein